MKRGPYKNRRSLYTQALELRKQGFGYRTISSKIGVSWRTIAGWVRDFPVSAKEAYEKADKSHREIDFCKLKDGRARRKRLIKLYGHECSSCGLDKWLDRLIPLELDHVNGDKDNNSLENCRLLCPNCHVFTPTYKGKNIRKFKKIMPS